MRMIDADALKAKLKIGTNTATYSDYCNGYCDARQVDLDAIDAAPTIEPEAPTIEPEVRHGDWNTIYSFDGDVYFRCSNCEEEFVLDDGNPKSKGWKYCPSCGCKMDGGADNG